MTPLANYLRDELARRGWSIEEFAKKAGLSLSNAYLIVRDGKDNVRRETFAGIAAALSMTPTELYAAIEPAPADPIEQAIRQRTAAMREAVLGTPQAFWPTIIQKTFDRAIDGAKDFAQLLSNPPTTVTTGDPGSVTTPKPSRKGGASGTDSGLPIWKQGQEIAHPEPVRPHRRIPFGFVTHPAVAIP
jgi:transcriptional regulator with XRE-family HTH domain